MPQDAPNPAPPTNPRSRGVIAAGLLLIALSLVVIYTSRPAFLSPLALVVVAAIGLAALLLQLRLRGDLSAGVRAPLWLNVLGLIFAIAAVIADLVHLSAGVMLVAALAGVICFALSGVKVIHSMRKQKN